MKLQLQHITICFHLLSFCLMTTLTRGNDDDRKYNNITYQFGTKPPSTSSSLRSTVQRVFSRQKRFLLLPPGGSLKFTVNIGKRMLFPYPRGFSNVIEVATYYEGFAQPSDLIPKFLRPSTTTTPKPKGPTTPIYVYIPGIGLRYKAVHATRPRKVQRIDDVSGTAFQWVDYAPKKIDYADPTNWQQYANYESNDYQQRLDDDWTPVAAMEKSEEHSSWWPPMLENELQQEPVKYYDVETYSPPSWQQYHGHRDRRQLFEKFEGFSKILGYDMKTCILRAICESKSLLLPRGYSMLQDMMRAILTMPVHHSTNDEYTHAVGIGDVDSCEQQFHQQCPISLLNWIMNPNKPTRK